MNFHGMIAVTLLLSCLQQDVATRELARSPVEVFSEIQQAFASGEWSKATASLSPGYKKGLLFECYHGSMFLPEHLKAEFERVQTDSGVDFEKAAEKSQTLQDRDFLDVALESAANKDEFVADMLSLVLGWHTEMMQKSGDPPTFHGDLSALTVDGDRASGVVTSTAKGIEFRETVYFRKFDGKWTLCLESEWKDRNYRVLIWWN